VTGHHGGVVDLPARDAALNAAIARQAVVAF
jgi:hypothetical protein